MSRVYQNIDPPPLRPASEEYQCSIQEQGFASRIPGINSVFPLIARVHKCVLPVYALQHSTWLTQSRIIMFHGVTNIAQLFHSDSCSAEPVFLNLQGAQESIPIPPAYVAWRVGS